ncbi:MAG TPA: peptidoglycan DD-metalloendopeptidase family protein [Burkholderiales bacterium]|nr:peptidoglycan DD-metalloendopeptidase family protein [Burkholderiales bacterium]
MKARPRLACVLLAALALAGCASRTDRAAPVVELSPAGRSATAASRPAAAPLRLSKAPARAPRGYYAVKAGDTLYSIALDHGADYHDVARWSGLDDPTKLRIGQLLRVEPPENRPGVKVGTAPGAGRIEARALDSPPKAGAEKLAPVAKQPPKPETAAPAGAVAFIWPARGKVIGQFAPPRSKGIDIEGKPGDPVVAAAPGRVTYVGSGIPGLGKLVVVKHDNGFITVYAHNREILVKEQQTVKGGQKIAELGATDSDRPKLHFQIRKGSAAVDPLRYLPSP